MGWNRASIGSELHQADFPCSADAFAPRCAMCRGLCGKMCFSIKLVLWACDVTRVMLRLYCFLPLKAATSGRAEVLGWCALSNRVTELGLCLNLLRVNRCFAGCCYSSCWCDSAMHDLVTWLRWGSCLLGEINLLSPNSRFGRFLTNFKCVKDLIKMNLCDTANLQLSLCCNFQN